MRPASAAVPAVVLVLLAVLAVRAQDRSGDLFGTPVGGVLAGNTTWTAAGSPYWMEDNVTVSPGSSLTIEPDVVVLVNGPYWLGSNGNLSIVGARGDPVTFGPNGTVPSWVGIWSGGGMLSVNWLTILRGSVMAQGVTGVRLENVTVTEPGGYGIVLQRVTAALLENIAVTRPSASGGMNLDQTVDARLANVSVAISGTQTGINGFDLDGFALEHFNVDGGQHGVSLGSCDRCVVVHGRISGVSMDGIDIQGVDSAVSDITVVGGASLGIQARGSRNTVSSNTLIGQGVYGIDLEGDNSTVSDNSVSGSTGDGIVVLSIWGEGANNTVCGNRVTGAGIAGIFLDYLVGSPRFPTMVTGNVVRSSGRGLLANTPSNYIVNNTFWRNGVGVELASDLNSVHHNHFEFNTVQAIDAGNGNLWSDEYPSGGNWWSDYRGRDLYKGFSQNIPGPDGIGDTPYDIDAIHRDTFPHYTMLAPSPPEHVTAQAAGPDVNVSWMAGPGPAADRFLVYRATEPTGFDFTAPVANVTLTNWADAGAALNPGPTYYTVRALNLSLPAFSATGNTAGTWTHTLPGGRSTFSLPLQPYPWIDYAQPGRTDTVGEMATDVGGVISYMENGTWRSVPGGGDPATPLAVGRGYLAAVPTARVLTFSGIPGGMIAQCGFPPCPYAGFDAAGDARNVSASVVGRDVVLRWTTPAGLDASDAYEIRVARTPAGVLGIRISDYAPFALNASGLPSEEFTHEDAAAMGGAWYYLVVPLKYGVWLGSSSYAVGVWMEDLPPGYTALGLPLAPYDRGAYLQLFVSNLSSPALKGVQWFDASRGDWVARAAWMPPGTYDARWERVMVVEVDAASPTRIVFVGV